MQRPRVRLFPAGGVCRVDPFHGHAYELAAIILMRIMFVLSLTILAALAGSFPALAQGTSLPAITSPTAGQVLQGQVLITGTSDVPNFASAELAFAYASNPTNTWFLISTSFQPAADAVLATWDTASISDGDYTLRLRVNLSDGSFQDATVTVQVRNYTVVTTPTLIQTPTEPALQIPTPLLLAPSATPTALPLPSPTPLPPNPAAITQKEIYASLRGGALIIAGIFIAIGLFLRLRRS